MPTLPLTSPTLPSGGDHPVRSEADVLAAYPERVSATDTAPVRDGIVAGQVALFQRYQESSDYAAAQSDPTRATGIYLEDFASEVGIHKQAGEDDEALRDRLFAPPVLVTPDAIKAAVDAVLARYTDKRCYLYETIADRVYVNDRADSAWKLYVGSRGQTMSPDYPDRRYALRERSEPGGPMVFNRVARGRFFVVRIPNLDAFDDQIAYGYERASVSRDRLFVFNRGSDSSTYVFNAGRSATAAYATIINSGEQLRGHGIRWRLLVDTKL